ncbi:MFS transporter [Thioalkalivibrio sp. HK1]|uniref:MFS transporter n=1 Tax=Thioalkalivibrio sp. HK1 TaxID=1469245 RepID=UPI000471B72C|nr:MFS transporter [Thioalkalivibrio sp. HK1]
MSEEAAGVEVDPSYGRKSAAVGGIDAFERRQDLCAIAFSNVAHTFTHLLTALYATAVLHLPLVFGMPYGEMLSLSSLGLVLYGVGALPAGWLADRWSRAGMMVIFFFGVGAGSILTGLADGPDMIFIGLTVIGLFASIYHPVGIAWIVASARRRGIVLGINGVFGNIGTSFAPVLVGMTIDFLSWRAAFLIPGILAILSGIGLLVALKKGLASDVENDRTPTPKAQPGAVLRVFLILTLTMTCAGFIYAGLSNTMPKLFEIALAGDGDISYTRIGLLVGVVSASTSIFGVFGGWLADRLPVRTIYIICWLLQIPLLLGIVSMSGHIVIAAILIVYGLNITFTAAENILVAQYSPQRWRSVAYGAKFALALGIAGLSVIVAGDLFDSQGNFDMFYIILGLAAISATIACILLPRESASTRVVEQPSLNTSN